MIRVKEPQNPVEGEITLTQDTAEVVIYRNGEWIYIDEDRRDNSQN